MPGRFTLRMQFGKHQDAAWIRDRLLTLVQRAPIDEIMFFWFAEDMNCGHETLEEIAEWIEHSRTFRDALTDAGVTVSLNPWHTVLHEDRNRTLKPGQNWQTMVSPTGRRARAVVCPLDEHWRTYYEETLRLYALEDFRVIWIDDDIRLHNHRPLDWGGCFCDLHVAEFNRRAGTDASRDQIVAACTAPGEPHPWRNVWLDMWNDTMTTMISRWREIVEAGGSRLGLMSSLPEAHAAEGRRWADWWKALAGDKPPVHRPHFWPYEDTVPEELPAAIAKLDQNRILQPDDVDSGPEIESHQYGPWNKSFRQNGAQLVLAHVLGSAHLNISLYDFLGNDPTDEPERMAFLRDWRPVCDWLADEFPMTLRTHGVGVPWSEDMSRRVHTDGSGRWQSLTCRPRDWTRWLGAVGHAFSMRPGDAINAIGGTMAWTHSEDDLRRWLSAGVLLDGLAAHILVERGFGGFIGVKAARMITQADALYSVENCLDAEFSVRPGTQMSINRGGYAERLFQGELTRGARVVSDLRDPRQRAVGHGEFLFENDLGGRVAVVPWCVDSPVSMSSYRAAQLTKTLAWLDPEGKHGWVEDAVWLIPQFLTDGKVWRGVVWNGSADAVEAFTVHFPADMPAPKSVVHIDGRGRRHEAQMAGGRIQLTRPLHQWESVAFL